MELPRSWKLSSRYSTLSLYQAFMEFAFDGTMYLYIPRGSPVRRIRFKGIRLSGTSAFKVFWALGKTCTALGFSEYGRRGEIDKFLMPETPPLFTFWWPVVPTVASAYVCSGASSLLSLDMSLLGFTRSDTNADAPKHGSKRCASHVPFRKIPSALAVLLLHACSMNRLHTSSHGCGLSNTPRSPLVKMSRRNRSLKRPIRDSATQFIP
jgi:hypothetical protein